MVAPYGDSAVIIEKNSDFLERLQNKAMRIIMRTNHLTCTQFMREKLGLLTLFTRRLS